MSDKVERLQELLKEAGLTPRIDVPPTPPSAEPLELGEPDKVPGWIHAQAPSAEPRGPGEMSPLTLEMVDDVKRLLSEGKPVPVRYVMTMCRAAVVDRDAALKERDEAQAKECICPACGTEWTSGGPQRLRTELIAAIMDERDQAIKELAENRERKLRCGHPSGWGFGTYCAVCARDAALARIKDYEHALMRLHDETVGQGEHLEHMGCTEGEWRDCYYGNDGDDSLKEDDLCNYHDAIVGARALLSRIAQAEGEKK